MHLKSGLQIAVKP